MKRKRIIIMGAGGRDFHNFNMVFRDNPAYEVVCFTATQIPNIEKRSYPYELAGELYPKGIKIYPEEELPELIDRYSVDEVVFAYSDVSFDYVMQKASIVISKGANFSLLGSSPTMLKSSKPVIAVTAVRTGCGKSQTSRYISSILRKKGKKVAIVRHPMPYGNLASQKVQKFETIDDFKKHNCTIEEIEEYEHHILNGSKVYAGVDYELILKEAEKEADVIIWDGGNNDIPFFKPNLWITVADPHRAGNEISYYPGMINFLSCDIVIINKVDTAEKKNVELVKRNAETYNPRAKVILANSPISIHSYEDKPENLIKGKKILAIEDGPTLTHGNMSYGAAVIAAKKYGATEIVDPRNYAVGSIKDAYKKYPQITNLLPALGYSNEQIAELEQTINNCPCDTVIIGTPIDLRRLIKINKPQVRVTYELEEITSPNLQQVISQLLPQV